MIPTSSETRPAKECRLLPAVRVPCYKSQRPVAARHKNIEAGDVVEVSFFFFFLWGRVRETCGGHCGHPLAGVALNSRVMEA